MDSGNSGSMQSSSGGEEEYDSRADSSSSLSAFLHNATNPTRRSHVGSLSHNLPQPPPQPPLPPPPLHHPHHMFDPLHSTNFLSLDNNNNNNMVIWPKNILVRSEFPSIIQTTGTDNNNNSNVNNSDLIPQVPDHHHHHHQLQPRTNSKKRSRASRRAPTTVLTTDTTNFRAMVQEFTGIPAPPFTSSSISGFQRTRLVDLFGTRSTHLVDPCSPPPHYLLRPFAQKFQPPPSTTTTSSTAITTSSSSSLIDVNFQHPSNMQNPTLLTLQSLLQHPPPPAPPPRFSIPDNPPPPIIGSKSPGANLEIHSRVLDDFSPSHGGIVNTNLGGLLPNLVSPDVTRSIENNPRSWVSGGGSSDGGGGGGDQAHLRSINGNSVALIHSELRTAN